MAALYARACVPESGSLASVAPSTSSHLWGSPQRWTKVPRRSGSKNGLGIAGVRCSVSSVIPTVDSELGEAIRSQFPILNQEVNGFPLVYLDSAATSQKPLCVIQAMDDYYRSYNSNVHRGVHALSARATDAYESARKKVAKFINTENWSELVFTRNASEAINLVANTWAVKNIHKDDEIVLTVAEHHSNLVPWQIFASKSGAQLKFAQLNKDGEVDYEQLLSLINNRTKLVSVHFVSNALGSQTPVEQVIEKAHKYGAKVLLDACQAVPHVPIDVQALNVDFLAGSGHKMCGPTGIGFLYSPLHILKEMPPFLGGGEMISEVFLEYSTFAEPPSKFEAGTPPIGEAIGLGAAVDFLTQLGMENVHNYELELSRYLHTQLKSVDGVEIYGPALGKDRAALCTFNVQGIHPTDLSTFLDQQHGIAIRSGHHCTQPLHRALGINSTARASLYLYNTPQEIDTFIQALKDTIDFFNPSF